MNTPVINFCVGTEDSFSGDIDRKNLDDLLTEFRPGGPVPADLADGSPNPAGGLKIIEIRLTVVYGPPGDERVRFIVRHERNPLSPVTTGDTAPTKPVVVEIEGRQYARAGELAQARGGINVLREQQAQQEGE